MILRLIVASSIINILATQIVDQDKTLKFVQIVWRHGDRNPTDPYPGDVYDKTFWDGRGGYGELTTRGMEMHVRLGSALKQRYANFLSPTYNAAEIYVRSTDVNRTIISAMANLIGMYGQDNTARPGRDYPTFADTPQFRWPANFVPVAVHTVDDNTDYLGNANAYCPRQDAIWKLAYDKAPEVQALRNSNDTIALQRYLNASMGVWYETEDLWKIHDVLYIERDNNLTLPNWCTPAVFDQITAINDAVEDFQDGIGLKPIDGIDFSVELPKLRAGALTADMRMHIDMKMNCETYNDPKACRFFTNLKYYAYSAHDETVASFLATLGAKSSVVPHGYPLYSSAAIVELWTDSQGAQFFKLVYHDHDTTNTTEPFKVVTSSVAGCAGDYCDYAVFQKRADLYSPGDAGKLCHDLSFLTSGSARSSLLVALLAAAILRFI